MLRLEGIRDDSDTCRICVRSQTVAIIKKATTPEAHTKDKERGRSHDAK